MPRVNEDPYGCALLRLRSLRLLVLFVFRNSGRDTIIIGRLEMDAEAIRNIRASQYVTVATFCLLVYDHSSSCISALGVVGRTYLVSPSVLTFSDELNLVWQSRSVNLVKILFIFNRYAVPAFLAVDTSRKLTGFNK